MKTYIIALQDYYLTKEGEFKQTKSPKLLTLNQAREIQAEYKTIDINCKIIDTWNSIDKRDWEEVE